RYRDRRASGDGPGRPHRNRSRRDHPDHPARPLSRVACAAASPAAANRDDGGDGRGTRLGEARPPGADDADPGVAERSPRRDEAGRDRPSRRFVRPDGLSRPPLDRGRAQHAALVGGRPLGRRCRGLPAAAQADPERGHGRGAVGPVDGPLRRHLRPGPRRLVREARRDPAGGADIRTFQVARSPAVSLTPDPCPPPEPAILDRMFELAWDIIADQEPVEVVLRFSAAVASRVREARWHPTERVEIEPDGSLTWRATVAGTIEIRLWILSWGDDVEVLSPAALRDDVGRTHARAAGRYELAGARP